MIKIIKIGDLIYQGYEEKNTNNEGKVVWNIPTDVDKFREIVIDTINWVAGQNIKNLMSSFTALSAANSKAIVLIVKLLSTLNPDTSKLTQLESDAYNKMLTLAKDGYSDSQLLNNSLQAVTDNIEKGSTLIAQATKATTIDELIKILNTLPTS